MHKRTKAPGSNAGPDVLPLEQLLLHLPLLCGPLTPPPSPLRLLDDSESQEDVREGLRYQACSRLLLMASRPAGNMNDAGNIGEYQ